MAGWVQERPLTAGTAAAAAAVLLLGQLGGHAAAAAADPAVAAGPGVADISAARAPHALNVKSRAAASLRSQPGVAVRGVFNDFDGHIHVGPPASTMTPGG